MFPRNSGAENQQNREALGKFARTMMGVGALSVTDVPALAALIEKCQDSTSKMSDGEKAALQRVGLLNQDGSTNRDTCAMVVPVFTVGVKESDSDQTPKLYVNNSPKWSCQGLLDEYVDRHGKEARTDDKPASTSARRR